MEKSVKKKAYTNPLLEKLVSTIKKITFKNKKLHLDDGFYLAKIIIY